MKQYMFSPFNFGEIHYNAMSHTEWLNYAGRNYDKSFEKSLKLFTELANEDPAKLKQALYELRERIDAEFTTILKKHEMTITLSHLIWGRMYIAACYFMHDEQFWVNTLIPMMEHMETDNVVQQDMLYIKKKIAESCYPKSLLAKQLRKPTIKTEYNMNNHDLNTEKFSLMTTYPCIRIAPYKEFSDGTKGSVLLLRYNAEDSLIVLIDSPERIDEYEHGKNNTLFPSEIDQFYAYRQACIEHNEGHYCISKERYDEFGIVVLSDVFVSAVIADFICENVNNQDPRRSNWATCRTSNLFSNALHGCKLSEIEDELKEFQSEDYKWQRAIILETLNLYHADKIFLKNINLDWKTIRNKYAEWLSHDNLTLRLCFAEHILQAYKEQPERDWRRLLEEVSRNRQELTEQFRYSKYGVQEIIGLYALCKYYYTQLPDSISIHYEHVAPQERIQIFEQYSKYCTNEMLIELNNEDNPYRTTTPTQEEAEDRAKKRIASLRGRIPLNLPAIQLDTYAKYEEGFCLNKNIGKQPEAFPSASTPVHQDIPQSITNFGTINQNLYFNHPFSSVKSETIVPPVGKESHSEKEPRLKQLFDDPQRTSEESNRFLNFLSDHNISSRLIDSSQDNPILKAVVCFCVKWRNLRYIESKYSPSAVLRFLTDTCSLQTDRVADRAIANALGVMIKNGYDEELYYDVCDYF